MLSPFYKRFLQLTYRNYYLSPDWLKRHDIALIGYLSRFYRSFSNETSGVQGLGRNDGMNLTYEKVESDDTDFLNDEPLYPEPFDAPDNLSLNRLISFRNNLNEAERVAATEQDELLNLISTKLTATDLKSRNADISSYLERVLREKVNPKCSVSIFGSAINGLWTDGSDLDVCVQIPNVNSRSGTIRNLRRIASVIGPLAPTRVFENRFTAKIPILHWKKDLKKRGSKLPKIVPPSNQDKFDFDCDNIPSIDISVNNILAITNSSLIGSYVAFEPRVRDMVLFLKIWAKSRNINDRSQGTLSSFTISLMVIHFLQNCTPPILPSIQDLAFSTNEPPHYVYGIDCRFSTDFNKIRAELNYLTKGKTNTLDNRTLLINFFRYFGWFNLHSQNKPILIRSVDPTEFNFATMESGCEMPDLKSDNVQNSGELFLHVDNPFEVGVDVATIAPHQRVRITSEFRKAYHLLKCGNSLPSLLNTS